MGNSDAVAHQQIDVSLLIDVAPEMVGDPTVGLARYRPVLMIYRWVGGWRIGGGLDMRGAAGSCAVLVVAVLVAAAGCGTGPRGSVSEPIPTLAGIHSCDPAALGASVPGAAGGFRGPGGVTFSCATLSVPLDHAELWPGPRQPGQLSLRVAVANNASAPRGVLVWLVGGPGEAGVGLTAVIADQFDPAVLRDYRLVMFSSRGTGSSALQCPQLQQAMDDPDQTVPPASAVRACAQSLGDNRRFYTTADTVADLDTLRQALRISKLTLDGASYGTFVAERYAITHPNRVSQLVLDSAVPHDSFDPLEITAFNRTAQVLRTICAQTRCTTDPTADLAQLIRRRHNGPQLFNVLSELTDGPPRLSGIPAALHDAAQGDDGALDAIIADEIHKHATPKQANPAELFSQGLHAATVCEDFTWPWGDATTPTPARAAALAKTVTALPDAALYPYDRATAAGNTVVATCEQWPPTPAVNFPTAADLPPVPTLLLAGDLDLDTPLAWTQHEATLAPNGHLVVIPGSGHITQNKRNPPAGRETVTKFLTSP